MGVTSSLVSTPPNHTLNEERISVRPRTRVVLTSLPKKSIRQGNHNSLFNFHEGSLASQRFSALDGCMLDSPERDFETFCFDGPRLENSFSFSLIDSNVHLGLNNNVSYFWIILHFLFFYSQISVLLYLS